MDDLVNHPKHYATHPSGIECIEITEHLSGNLANAFKYLFRCDQKGAKQTDLEKANWYVQRELARLHTLEKSSMYFPYGLGGHLCEKCRKIISHEPDHARAFAMALIVEAAVDPSTHHAVSLLTKAHGHLRNIKL